MTTTNPTGTEAAAAGGTPGIPTQTKRRKRKYSRGLKTVQRFGRAGAKAGSRVARAVAAGFETWVERSDASAEKKRDGAIRDGVRNLTRAVTKAMKKATGAPNDLIKPLTGKRAGRVARRMARMFAPPFMR